MKRARRPARVVTAGYGNAHALCELCEHVPTPKLSVTAAPLPPTRWKLHKLKYPQVSKEFREHVDSHLRALTGVMLGDAPAPVAVSAAADAERLLLELEPLLAGLEAQYLPLPDSLITPIELDLRTAPASLSVPAVHAEPAAGAVSDAPVVPGTPAALAAPAARAISPAVLDAPAVLAASVTHGPQWPSPPPPNPNP